MKRLFLISISILFLSFFVITQNQCPPQITRITPDAAIPGATVTISGNNFGNTQGNGQVKFGNVSAVVTSWTKSTIVSTVPKLIPSNVEVYVIRDDGVESERVPFEVLPADPEKIIHYFPISGWNYTNILMTNPNNSNLDVSLNIYDAGGILKKIVTTTIVPNGAVASNDIVGNIYSITNPASIEIITKNPISINYGMWNNSNKGGAETSLPINKLSGREFLFPISGWGNAYVTISNPNGEVASIMLQVYDSNGILVKTDKQVIPPKGIYNSWNTIGNIFKYVQLATIYITTDINVTVNSAIWDSGTNGTGWGIGPLPLQNMKGKRVFFPIAGWSYSWFLLSNAGVSTANVTLTVYDANGISKKQASTTIPAKGVKNTWDWLGNLYSFANPGSVEIISDQDMTVTSGRWDNNGGWGYEVPADTVIKGKKFQLDLWGWNSAWIDVSNPGNSLANVVINIYDKTGAQKGTHSLKVPSKGFAYTWGTLGNIYSVANPAVVIITSDQDVIVDDGRYTSGYDGWGTTWYPLQ